MRGLLRAIMVALAAACTLPAAASASIPAPPSQWYGLPGLDAASGAQWVRAFAYSTPPNVVYAGLEGGGVYRSVTGGASWAPFNAGFDNPLTTNVRALMASSTGTTVWAGTDSGLWKSTGGAPWQPIAQGPEDDPANPKKLNQSVQAVIGLPGSTMLAGVFSGGVYRSTDDGATWKPPAANNGMPASETIWSLTSNIPGVVYATGSDGVFLSIDQGSTWTRMSDGIPDSATPMVTWSYPQKPNILYAGTASNGIYRSVTGGLTWSPINTGLGAVRARGLQIFTSAQGAHLYAATENGLWETSQTGTILPTDQPKWHAVTQQGLITPQSTNTIMWALTAPEIPGAGALGLITGTQSNGGYFLSFEPVDSACPTSGPSPTTDNTNTNCPRLNATAVTAGDKLTATVGAWTGTKNISYDYQWQSCTTTSAASCSDIADAEESSYVIPDAATGKRFRVVVTASNPAPSFGLVKRPSAISGAAGALPSSAPGYNQSSPPSISVNAPGSTTSPEVGDTMYAEYGISPSAFSDGWFNPKSTAAVKFQWLRCDTSGVNCNEIPGATARSYVLKTADGNRYLKVRVTGTANSLTTELTSGTSYYVISAAAAIADPIPDPDGGPAKAQSPSVSGKPYVGETLVGSVGGWKDPTTDFLRRWLRCDPDGTSCSTIYKPATVDPADGPTYQVQPADKGYVIRLRVTADVNNDLTPDGIDNHLPHATEYDTVPTAVITDPPVPPAPGGGGSGGGSGQPADPAPTLGGLHATKTSFVAGKGTVFQFSTSEGGTMRSVITKATKGRLVKGACKPVTKKNRTKKKCTYQRVLGTLEQPVSAGVVSVPFSGKIGKKKLAPGKYTVTFVVIDGSGHASAPVSLVFTIKRH